MKRNILLIATSLIIFLSCASNNQTPQDSYTELSLPENLFMENPDINVFMSNEDMIKTYAEEFGVRPIVIIDFISEVYLSSKEDDFVMTLVAHKIRYKRKIEIMKLIKAESIDQDMRFWKYIEKNNGNTLYLDIGYEKAIIISNMEVMRNDDLFGWDMPALFQDKQYANVDGWVWSPAENYLENIGLQNILPNISINWMALFIVNYQKDNDSNVTIALQHDGNKSSRTTIKLFIPLIMKSFGNISGNNNVPEFELDEDILLFKNIFLNEAVLKEYMK